MRPTPTLSLSSTRSCVRGVMLLGVMLLVGCGGDTDVVDDLHRHTEAITAIMESHRDDPRGAITAIEAYEETHAEELAELGRRSRKIRADLGQRSKRNLRAHWNARSAKLRKRLEALTEGFKE